MKNSILSLVVICCACGGSSTPTPEPAVETPVAGSSQDVFVTDLDMMCSALSHPDVRDVNPADRMQALTDHISSNLQSDDGRDLFQAIATVPAADKAVVLGDARQEAGHSGDCELQTDLAVMANGEASAPEAESGEVVGQ
ncbi:MAG: hypothetical protein AB8H86_00935 [Polyangiales bacterium]